MKRITVSLKESHIETLDDIEESEDVNNRSEALRWLFAEYDRLQTEYDQRENEYEDELQSLKDDHQDEISELQSEIDELENKLELERQKTKQVLDQRDEKKELVKYVQQERTVEQRYREASITKRLKWKVFGMDSDDE